MALFDPEASFMLYAPTNDYRSVFRLALWLVLADAYPLIVQNQFQLKGDSNQDGNKANKASRLYILLMLPDWKYMMVIKVFFYYFQRQPFNMKINCLN